MTLSFAPERIEQWPLARLQPCAKNAKTHGADQVAKIAASMAEDGELIAGHGRPGDRWRHDLFAGKDRQ
jgi:hypothetical protein